jgi:predicted ATPase
MFLSAIHARENRDETQFPFTLTLMRDLATLEFQAPVTFLVGENGSGKSTLLEGLAAGMDAVAAGSADLKRDETLQAARTFANGFRFVRKRHAKTRLFLRAEDVFGFVQRVNTTMRDLSEMEEDVEGRVKGDYGRQLARGVASGQRGAMREAYGDDADARSHGETFLAVLKRRIVPHGLYFLDEPEAPLSPARVLALLTLIKDAVTEGCQFIVSTHSPILMALPLAEIYLLADGRVAPIAYDDVEHVTFTKAFLNDPQRFLRHI